MVKSSTDEYWNERAAVEKTPEIVNLGDETQRLLETDFILRHLSADAIILEVGCGNGFLTSQLRNYVKFIDGFDYAENMISQAKELYGEENNRFFIDNLLEPRAIRQFYDIILCVRVLINLRDLIEQERAITNMASRLATGGKLILIEGYSNGFEKLNELRLKAGTPPLKPASINYYSSLEEMQGVLTSRFEIHETFHTGLFDFLTRVIYPLLVGADKATGYGDFHQKILPLVRVYNPDLYAEMARVHGMVLVRK